MFSCHKTKQEQKPHGLAEKRVVSGNKDTPQEYKAVSGRQKQLISYNESVTPSSPLGQAPGKKQVPSWFIFIVHQSDFAGSRGRYYELPSPFWHTL